MDREIAEENIANVYQSCAACRYQRKRCDENCMLAPYFPDSRYREFQNAQRIFGVSNIVKIMNSVEPNLRQDTAESILVEGNARSKDPVHGCLGMVLDLHAQIRFYEEQLQSFNKLLSIFRGNKELQQNNHLTSSMLPLSSSSPPPPFQYQSNGFSYPEPMLFDHSDVGEMKSLEQGVSSQSVSEGRRSFKFFHVQPANQNQNGISSGAGESNQ